MATSVLKPTFRSLRSNNLNLLNPIFGHPKNVEKFSLIFKVLQRQAKCGLKISLSDDMVEKIQKYKEFSHKQSIEETVVELINNALRLPHYFMKYDWNKAEIEANHVLSKKMQFQVVSLFF